MKLITVRPFYFQCLYSGYDVEEDPANPDLTYNKPTPPFQISCTASTNPLGELTIYTDALLQNNGSITGLTNRQGELLYPDGIPVFGALWRIMEGQPLTDSWGNKNRYRYRCFMVVPKQGSVTEDTPTELGTAAWWS